MKPMVTQNVTIAPATVERRIFLTSNGRDIFDWSADEMEDAKADARRYRKGGMPEVKLTWRTVEREAYILTPLGYAYLVESLAQDEADLEQWGECVHNFGEPDWSLIEVDRRACVRAGLKPWENWPEDMDPTDFGGVPIRVN